MMTLRPHLPRPLSSLFILLLVWMILPSHSLTAQQRRPWKTSKIAGMPKTPPAYKVVPAFPNASFVKPTSIEELVDQQQILVTQMDGKIFTLDKSGKRPAALVGDLAKLAKGSVSLFHATQHPQFATNRQIFVCYVHPGNGRHTRVSRFKVTKSPQPKLVSDSEQVIIRWPAGGHNGGCLQFGRDGMLYISTGDGSGPNPPDGRTTGQDVTDLLGAILRIDVDKTDKEKAYSIPNGNPFAERENARSEIWAYGLRNPWKFGLDSKSNAMYVADNGWETWELVHRIEAGTNCGWPVMEGRAVLRSEVKVGPTPIKPPVKDHHHSEANSVIGGPIYHGAKLKGIQGSFVYGDYITGTIWALKPTGSDAHSHQTLVDTDLRIVHFTEGSAGELFVLDYDYTGQIYELVPSGLTDNSADFPRRLSDTGLFSDVKALKPSAGVVPYQVVASRYHDQAWARRWIAIPGKGKVQLATEPGKASKFPPGTVLVKHLEFAGNKEKDRSPVRLETQILHYEYGRWNPYSYVWNDEGTDAQLVDSIGMNRPVTTPWGAKRTWRVGAENECRLCHNAGSHSVLGFELQQLNRVGKKQPGSQLSRLATRGVIDTVPPVDEADAGRLVNPHDTAQSLDDRARSYLHANCSSCHHPGGNAIVSFYMRRYMPFDELKTNKTTGIGTFGMRNAKLIVPGDPYRSVLFYRMSKLGYSRMPYIGSQVVDRRGVVLIESWIRKMADPGKQGSAPTKASSDVAKALQLLKKEGQGTPAERRDAVDLLLETTEGTLALAAAAHAKLLPRKDFSRAVNASQKLTSADRRGLLETYVPESKRKARLGPNAQPEDILKLTGDPARGRLIFFSDGARCRNCHDVNDRSKSLGPSLREINKKYPKAKDMVQHALQPSLKVDDAFAAYVIATENGRILTGLIVEKTDDKVTLLTSERKRIEIATDDIAQMRKATKSLMPDFILSDLTAQEAADLIQYIRSLGASKTP